MDGEVIALGSGLAFNSELGTVLEMLSFMMFMVISVLALKLYVDSRHKFFYAVAIGLAGSGVVGTIAIAYTYVLPAVYYESIAVAKTAKLFLFLALLLAVTRYGIPEMREKR